jgi:hypothetical protein
MRIIVMQRFDAGLPGPFVRVSILTQLGHYAARDFDPWMYPLLRDWLQRWDCPRLDLP